MDELSRLKVLVLALIISGGIYFISQDAGNVVAVKKPEAVQKVRAVKKNIENKIYSIDINNSTKRSVTVEVDFGFDGKSLPASLNVIADMYPGMVNKHMYSYVLDSEIREKKENNNKEAGLLSARLFLE